MTGEAETSLAELKREVNHQSLQPRGAVTRGAKSYLRGGAQKAQASCWAAEGESDKAAGPALCGASLGAATQNAAKQATARPCIRGSGINLWREASASGAARKPVHQLEDTRAGR